MRIRQKFHSSNFTSKLFSGSIWQGVLQKVSHCMSVKLMRLGYLSVIVSESNVTACHSDKLLGDLVMKDSMYF